MIKEKFKPLYEEEQIGWIPSLLLITVFLFISLAYFNERGNDPFPLSGYTVSTAVILMVFLLFYKMKVRIDRRVIHVVYGIGVIRIKIEFDKIREVEVAKTSWYQGLGIRITSEGMLYNIHGLDAVKVCYSKGGLKSRVMIGSSDPDSLREFLIALN